MNHAGLMITYRRLLLDIIKARESNSFKALDKAIGKAREILPLDKLKVIEREAIQA
jgi:hypothetical protein